MAAAFILKNPKIAIYQQRLDRSPRNLARRRTLALSSKDYTNTRAECWDSRPFGHNRRGPKSVGLLCAFPWGSWVLI